MPNLDIFSLPRPQPVIETRTFTDPLQPGVSLEISIVAEADYGLSLAALDLANEKYALHVTGRRGPDGKQIAPTPLPRIPDNETGRVPRLGISLCNAIASLFVLQSYVCLHKDGNDTPPVKKQYNFLEWLAASVNLPNAFGEAAEWAGRIHTKAATGEADDPNEQADA